MLESRAPIVKGISAVTPNQIVKNDDFHDIFPKSKIEKFEAMSGIKSRFVCEKNEFASDLMKKAIVDVANNVGWELAEVDALIVVSQSPEFRFPATACVLQDQLGLSKDTIAFDINLGCSGYIYGLKVIESMLSEHQKGILVVGDHSTKLVNPQDPSTAMLFGDCAAATAVQKSANHEGGFYKFGTDGSGKDHLSLKDAMEYRNEPQRTKGLFMDGSEIFKFTITSVRKHLKDILENNLLSEKPDFYVFHQANKFLLDHLAKKLMIPSDMVPICIDRFGNTSSASIPLTISSELGNSIRSRKNLLISGFGVGYSWGSHLLSLDPNVSLRAIKSNGEIHASN